MKKISPFPRIIVSIFCVCGMLASYFFFYAPVSKRSHSIAEAMNQLSIKNSNNALKVQKISILQKQKKDKIARLEYLKKHFKTTFNQKEILKTIVKALNKSGITLSKYVPITSSSGKVKGDKDIFQPHCIQINFDSTFYQLLKFLKCRKDFPPNMNIDNIELSSRQGSKSTLLSIIINYSIISRQSMKGDQKDDA